MRNITIHIHSSSLKEVSTFTFRMVALCKCHSNNSFEQLKKRQKSNLILGFLF